MSRTCLPSNFSLPFSGLLPSSLLPRSPFSITASSARPQPSSPPFLLSSFAASATYSAVRSSSRLSHHQPFGDLSFFSFRQTILRGRYFFHPCPRSFFSFSARCKTQNEIMIVDRSAILRFLLIIYRAAPATCN